MRRNAEAREATVSSRVADISDFRPVPPLDLELVTYVYVPGTQSTLARATALPDLDAAQVQAEPGDGDATDLLLYLVGGCSRSQDGAVVAAIMTCARR